MSNPWTNRFSPPTNLKFHFVNCTHVDCTSMFLICSKWNNAWPLTLEPAIRVTYSSLGRALGAWGPTATALRIQSITKEWQQRAFSLPSCKSSVLKRQPVQMGPGYSGTCLQTLKNQGFWKPVCLSHYLIFKKKMVSYFNNPGWPRTPKVWATMSGSSFILYWFNYVFLRQVFLETPGWPSIHSSPPASASWVLYSQT